MDVLIITPGHPGPDRKSLPPAATAPYLAALATPYAEDIRIVDLAVEDLDTSRPVPDVILLTSTMAQFTQILNVANFYKGKGATIILGGPYASLAYENDHRIRDVADCVVFGEAEHALPKALTDLSAGRLQPTYSIPVDSLAGIPFSRLDLLDHRKYYYATTLIGTRGCANNCGYCSIKDLYGHKYLKRPVEEVIAEIKYQTSRKGIGWINRKCIMFWDDNPHCDLEWFHELMEKMIPLKKWWLSQMCLNVADNIETVKLMKASGCKGIFAGIESISRESLAGQNKAEINSVDKYIHQARTLIDNGINVVGAMMFGFDEDTRQSLFIDTPETLDKMGLTLLQAHIVTPYPHMDFYRKLEKENRLITKQEKYYNGYTLVHRPVKMSPCELQDGFIRVRKRFYSLQSILRRMRKHKLSNVPEFLIWNALYQKPNYQAIPGVDIQAWLRFLKTL
jgi:radical SAM superfamily enzyme YgiQ (UPF0313 family)